MQERAIASRPAHTRGESDKTQLYVQIELSECPLVRQATPPQPGDRQQV